MTATTAYRHPDLSVDQALALKTAASRLAAEFDGTDGPETIERFLHSSYDQVATAGSIPNVLPLLADRFARQRLQALARVEGHNRDGKPVELFGDRAVAWSGGSEPGLQINPTAVAAMAERGIDISGKCPKPWTDEVVHAADVVITMGCGDACPVFPGTRYENWDLDDPASLNVDDVRPIRDYLEHRVRHLLDQLHVPAA